MFAIRRAEPADEPQLFALTRAFATTFVPEPEPFAHAFRHLLQQEDAALFVAERTQELTGYLLGFDHYSLSTNGRISWVEELMVREDCRRLGLGRELMSTFERWALERHSQLIALATRRAAPFYTAIGYEQSAVYFRKKLNG